MEQNERDGHLEMIRQAETAALFALARIQSDTEIDMEAAAIGIAEAFEIARKALDK